MRPGQHNNKRNRNRNRRHGGGGMGGNSGGGGNSANRVYDSNGPDVKLRGTAQTIAEKYMQLGRDAQSSGDSVMAESYFQFGDHYYRLWLAAQPAGQPIQFSRRMAEEDMEDEQGESGAEGEEETTGNEAATGEGGESAPLSDEGGDQAPSSGEPAEAQPNGQHQRQGRQRDFQPRNKDGEGGRNFRQRWPRRNERFQQEGEGQPVEGASSDPQERPHRAERPDRSERIERSEQAADAGDNWEAPSFLKRPAPAVSAEEAPREESPRPRRSRSEAAKPAPEEAPQGD